MRYHPSIRRFFAFFGVFVLAFSAVLGVRMWRAGTFHFPESSASAERFTLQDNPLLNIEEVELLSRLDQEYEKLTRAVVPSVVSIDTAGVRVEQLRDFWGRSKLREQPTQGQGSGVIVTREGHVVTNFHVVEGQQQIRVTLHGGRTHRATLVGKDSLLDIAILKIESDGPFVPLKFGNSAEVEVGQLVFAVGNPFGLGETVTQGIISAKERSLSDNQRDLFQTDAAINPGNSGGPLVNFRGEIVGINVAIFSTDRENPGFMGVGFSIPSNDVKETLLQILDRGRPTRGYLGVRMHDLEPSVRAAIQYPEEHGAVVMGVLPGSPANAAGLKPWDVVKTYNDIAITSVEQFLNLVQRTRIGSVVRMKVWRQGETIEIGTQIVESEEAALALRAAQAETATSDGDPASVLDAVGVTVRNLNAGERRRGLRGIFVTQVDPGKAAASRLAPGDFIMAVNNIRVETANDFLILMAASAATRETTIYLIRNNQPLRVVVPPVGNGE